MLYPYIKATDELGNEYMFGTNLNILNQEVERYKHHDLERLEHHTFADPDSTDHSNKVEVLYVDVQLEGDESRDTPLSMCKQYLRWINQYPIRRMNIDTKTSRRPEEDRKSKYE